MRVPNLMLSSILNRLMPSLSACEPQVGRWICIMPIASLSEMAKGLARLSTIIMLATSRGSTSYLRPLATMAPAIRGRWPTSTLYFRGRRSYSLRQDRLEQLMGFVVALAEGVGLFPDQKKQACWV